MKVNHVIHLEGYDGWIAVECELQCLCPERSSDCLVVAQLFGRFRFGHSWRTP